MTIEEKCMTIEEKRRAIEEHCMRLGESCDGCPLQPVNQRSNCYTPSDDPQIDADVERNYRILFGNAEEADHPRCGLKPPIRLDMLLRRPARAAVKVGADDQRAGGINIALNVDTSGLDAAIEKANRLVELLENADRILDRVVQKMGAAKDTEK